jgi:hypothetical protein
LQVNGEPTPLQKLAKLFFAVCANSASCERLFSLLGIIRRSQLRSKAMTELAELLMHLRDENHKQGTPKERLKRKFTSHGSGATTVLETEPPSQEASMPVVCDEEDSTDPSGTSDSAQGPSCSLLFTSVANRLIAAHSPLEDLNEADEAEPGPSVQI